MKEFFSAILLVFILYIFYQFKVTENIQIDKIYIVNLPRATDRLKHMKSQLAGKVLPSKYEFFKAIDYSLLVLENIETGDLISGEGLRHYKGEINGKYKIKCSPEWEGGFNPIEINLKEVSSRFAGEIACMCSHKKIWEEVAQKKYHNVLILEDDVNFIPYFDLILKIGLKFVPKDYDILYLSTIADSWHYNARTRIKGFNKITNIFNNIFRYTFFKRIKREPATTVAYIIKADAAEKIIDNMNYLKGNPILVADGVLGTLVTKKELRAYVFKPLLAGQKDNLSSSIHN